jgi:hypothetical protein
MSCRNKRSRQNRPRGFGDKQTHVHQTFICVYGKRNKQSPTYKLTCLTYISNGPGEVNPEMNCGHVHGRGGQLRCTQTPTPRTKTAGAWCWTFTSIQYYTLYIKNAWSFTSNFPTRPQDLTGTRDTNPTSVSVDDYGLPWRDTVRFGR